MKFRQSRQTLSDVSSAWIKVHKLDVENMLSAILNLSIVLDQAAFLGWIYTLQRLQSTRNLMQHCTIYRDRKCIPHCGSTVKP